MTNEQVIDYLKQYKDLNKSIERLIDEKERFKSIALKVTPTWSDMPKGSDGENPRELAICKMMDCENEITRQIDEYVDLGNEIKSVIKKLDKERLRLIIAYKYIDGLSHEKIAEKVGISVYWVGELHAKAINEITVYID